MVKLENTTQTFKQIGGSFYIPIPNAVLDFHKINPKKPVHMTLTQEEETT